MSFFFTDINILIFLSSIFKPYQFCFFPLKFNPYNPHPSNKKAMNMNHPKIG